MHRVTRGRDQFYLLVLSQSHVLPFRKAFSLLLGVVRHWQRTLSPPWAVPSVGPGSQCGSCRSLGDGVPRGLTPVLESV